MSMTFKKYLQLRQKAFSLIEKTSKDVMRFSPPIDNLPYWSHLLNVHNFLILKGETEYELLIAALLHDILEDSDVTKKYLQEEFGDIIAETVFLVSKPEEYNPDAFYAQISTNKSAMKIKVADRIDNILTDYVYSIGQDRIKGKFQETQKYFLPMAKILGWEADLQNALNYFATVAKMLI